MAKKINYTPKDDTEKAYLEEYQRSRRSIEYDIESLEHKIESIWNAYKAKIRKHRKAQP